MTLPPHMLKITAASLLSGLLAVIAGILLLFAPGDTVGNAEPLTWRSKDMLVDTGTGSITDAGLALTLNDNGRGILRVNMSPRVASAYAFVELQFAGQPPSKAPMLLWRSTRYGNQVLTQALYTPTDGSIRVFTDEIPYWEDELTALGVMLSGRPGESLVLESISLSPYSLDTQIAWLWSNWTSFTPWKHFSINAHTGVDRTGAPLYPVAAVAALLALSLLAYGIFLLLSRSRLRFDWRVPAAIFLACWLGLDLVWQGRLMRQLEITRQTFAGLDNEQKRSAGADRLLYGFIAEAGQQIADGDARVFVSSSDDYLGMRAAYFLYPRNVYWKRHGPELPPAEQLHSGDYIVLVRPSRLQFDEGNGSLRTQYAEQVDVTPLMTHPVGQLLRVL